MQGDVRGRPVLERDFLQQTFLSQLVVEAWVSSQQLAARPPIVVLIVVRDRVIADPRFALLPFFLGDGIEQATFPQPLVQGAVLPKQLRPRQPVVDLAVIAERIAPAESTYSLR